MKVEVLVGERQDGNLGEIDLLLARQREQKVERTFEALDVDDERRLVVAALRRIALELDGSRRSCAVLRARPGAAHEREEVRAVPRRDRSAPPGAWPRARRRRDAPLRRR